MVGCPPAVRVEADGNVEWQYGTVPWWQAGDGEVEVGM